MYAGLLIHKENGCCIAFTDHAGKKPLILWNSKAGRHIGTGVDSAYIDDNSTQIEVFQPGIHNVNVESGITALASKPPKVQPVRLPLSELLKMAVADRIPENLPFAVALSGGLDSSILAYIIEKQLCLRPEYYVIGDQLPDSVSSLMESLGIGQDRVKLIKPETDNNLRTLLIDTCRVIKSFNPSIISNGMATMMLAKAVHEDGYRVLLGGEGADEFFCGYQAMYNGKHCPEDMRTALISSLHFTELRRVDLACSYHSVEARCPFLDQRVTSYALGVSAEMHCSKVQKAGKLPLREAYKGLLPDVIINAAKEPFDITSGLQLQVIKLLKAIDASERKALEIIFKGVMGSANIFENDYFSKYPAFDDMIDRRDRKYQANII
ncbi:asparagine synthase C-terminal domain-containing protein [Endozoicomonas atrinae]|uniref:asparagine synthase C-terminal domain-containing protein n=1 Tax=Endozoicomonas atrinae TaxID=1333660 RepID=UPI0008269EA1|nr:asparagine synthase C-terminal domain-containing protein [Endozoicomonas atrinae]